MGSKDELKRQATLEQATKALSSTVAAYYRDLLEEGLEKSEVFHLCVVLQQQLTYFWFGPSKEGAEEESE